MINGIIQAFSLVTSVALSFIVNRFTRRSLWLTSTIGIFVCFIAWTICESLYEIHGNAAAGRTVLGLIFIYNFFFNIGWTPLQVVCEWRSMWPSTSSRMFLLHVAMANVDTDCIEILPIAIRARGLAIYNLSVSLAGFLNQYLNPVGLANIGWKCEWRCGHDSTSDHPPHIITLSLVILTQSHPPGLTARRSGTDSGADYIVYDVWIAFELVIVYLFFPETKNNSLEETAAMFDGAEIVEDIAMKGQQAVDGHVSQVVEQKAEDAGEKA
jgi:hypothetical protein